MEEGKKINEAVQLDTSIGFKRKTGVETDLAELRQKIRSRLLKTFESLPEIKFHPLLFSLEKYIKQNPQSVIFVPQKDLNMYPILIEEAKCFVNSFKTRVISDKRIAQVRDHEFEHIQKAYELGVNIMGIGFVLLKYRGRPSFAGFATSPEDEDVSLKDRIAIALAPKTLASRNTGDMLNSQKWMINALMKAKSFEEFDQIMSDTLFVIAERYLPKKLYSFLQKKK